MVVIVIKSLIHMSSLLKQLKSNIRSIENQLVTPKLEAQLKATIGNLANIIETTHVSYMK